MTDTTQTLAWRIRYHNKPCGPKEIPDYHFDPEAEFKTVIQGLYDPHDSPTYHKKTRKTLIKIGIKAAGKLINSEREYAIVNSRIGVRDIGSIDFETALSALVAARVGLPMTREELLAA